MSPETISLVSMLCTIAGAVAGLGSIFIAGFALRTWQQEMKGRTEYETARRVLRASYKVRNAFGFARRSLDLFGVEPKAGEDETNRMERKLELEMPILIDAIKELETEATDAEVLWEQKIEQHVRTLRSCWRELHMAKGFFVEFKSAPDEVASKQRVEWRQIIYAGLGDDKFSQKINNAVKAIKDELQPLLGRKR